MAMEEDIFIEWLHDGSFALSAMVYDEADNETFRYHERFIGYTEDEAIERFKESIVQQGLVFVD